MACRSLLADDSQFKALADDYEKTKNWCVIKRPEVLVKKQNKFVQNKTEAALGDIEPNNTKNKRLKKRNREQHRKDTRHSRKMATVEAHVDSRPMKECSDGQDHRGNLAQLDVAYKLVEMYATVDLHYLKFSQNDETSNDMENQPEPGSRRSATGGTNDNDDRDDHDDFDDVMILVMILVLT